MIQFGRESGSDGALGDRSAPVEHQLIESLLAIWPVVW